MDTLIFHNALGSDSLGTLGNELAFLMQPKTDMAYSVVTGYSNKPYTKLDYKFGCNFF